MSNQVNQMHQEFDKYKQAIDRALHDASKPWTKGFDYLERETNVPRMQIFCGGAAFCCLYLIFGYGAQLLCNIIGVLYPAYESIQSIESNDKNDIQKWLIYWITYSVLSLVEFFPLLLVSLVPCYWLLKCMFLIWCMLPMEQNGAFIVYSRIVRPYVMKLHDNLMDKLKKEQ